MDRAGYYIVVEPDPSERITKRVPSLVDSDEASARYPAAQLHTNYECYTLYDGQFES